MRKTAIKYQQHRCCHSPCRFRSGTQSFLYCYRNLAKWLGVPYYAWRNTDTGSEDSALQNVNVNLEQLLPVVTAALAAAATKAQARALGGHAAVFHQREKPFELRNDAAASRRFEPVAATSSSESYRISAAAALLLLLLLIASAALSKFCRVGCKRTLFCLLAFAALLAQVAVIDFHDFYHNKLQQPAATKSASPDVRRSPPVNLAAAVAVGQTSPSEDTPSSLYAQFLRRYSSVTGAFLCLCLQPSQPRNPIYALNPALTTCAQATA